MNKVPAAEQTVYLVEDDDAVGQALCELLASASIQALHFSSAEMFLEAWKEPMAGCLILDVRLPGISGMELQAELGKRGAQIPIIVMTAHGDIPMVRKALRAGAVEFLTKPFKEDELLAVVEEAFVRDRTHRSIESEIEGIRARVATLTERERQVIALVTTGRTNPEIARQIYLSVVTVKLYRRQAMEKLGVDSVAELVKMWEKIQPATATL